MANMGMAKLPVAFDVAGEADQARTNSPSLMLALLMKPIDTCSEEH